MRNTITLNGIKNTEIPGLIIQTLPAISKPLMRTEIEEIDGRDGDIITPLGFSAYDKEITIGLYGQFDINAIIAYFNSKGTVIFSNEPDKFYNYQIINQIDFERLLRYRTATVTMHCQPFKYSTTESPITLGSESGTTVSGEGTDITLENTTEAQFAEITPKGDTNQQTYTGKNLYDATTASVTNKGITYSADNSTFSVNGTATSDFACNLLNKPLSAGTYTLTLELVSGTVTSTASNAGADFLFNGDNITRSPNAIFVSTANPKKSMVVTVSADTTNAHLHLWARTTETFTNAVFKYQLISGSTADYDFEPYVGGTASPNPDYPQEVKVVTGEQTVKVTGKNLLKFTEQSSTVAGVEITINQDGTAILNGTATEDSWKNLARDYSLPNYILWAVDSTTQSVTGGGYTYSASISNGVLAQVMHGASNGWFAIKLKNGETYNNAVLRLQLEAGTVATDWQPYQSQQYTVSLGNIELCKIGNYQDYFYKDGNDWYLHEEIGKVVLDGTEGWKGNSNVFYSLPKTDSKMAGLSLETYGNLKSICSHFTKNVYDANIIGQYYSGSTNLNFNWDGTHTNLAGFKTWLASNDVRFYAPLATPTDTQITEAHLISQLNALENANSYKPVTYIRTTSDGENLPVIIKATTAGYIDGTITNSGNTIARPKLTIFGSGNIGISINGVQIFEIALGSEGHITIDTNAMEAYKDTMDNLKNRLVTGDYSKFVLNPGDNQIGFSGNTNMCVVENYSRWI